VVKMEQEETQQSDGASQSSDLAYWSEFFQRDLPERELVVSYTTHAEEFDPPDQNHFLKSVKW